MQPELQRRVQRYGWDRASDYYETGWEEQLWPAQEILLELVDPQPGERILDVSCGTGLVTIPLADLIMPGGNITGIDISEKMIEQAKFRKTADDNDNVNYIRMDAEDINLPDGTFSKVVCSLGLMYFPDPDKALAEMYRVLKPGGQLSALVWGERDACGWAEIFPIVDKRVKTDVCPLFFQLGTGKALEWAFKNAGFTSIHSTRFSENLRFKNDEQAFVAAFWGGAVALAYQKFDEATRTEARKEYLESIQQYRRDDGYHIPCTFVTSTGRKDG